MRIAIVSDVHGNLTALEAVIAVLNSVSPDLVLHGGDLAYGGARPAEVVDRIRDLGWPGVCGNTDEMLWAPEGLHDLAAKTPKLQSLFARIEEMIPTTNAWLGEDRLRWLKTLPYIQRRETVAVVHASPDNVWRGPLPEASDAELSETFGCLNAPVAVYGHIHRPFVRNLPETTVANAGSLSLSYDGDTRASYLVVDDTQATVRRVAYDLEREVQALMQSGLPHREWFARTLQAGHFVPPE